MTDGLGPSTAKCPAAVLTLIEEARFDVTQRLKGESMSRAEELVARTAVPFDPCSWPMYFTGDFAARLVLVHLNPKLAKAGQQDKGFTSFDDYKDGHRHFGARHWRNPAYFSPFDLKQVRFLRPFGVIDFVEERTKEDKRRNAALAIDEKLQLELVPYASVNFPTHLFGADLLQPHYDRVMGVVTAYPRTYVIFCGAVFGQLLEPRILSREDHQFHLPTVAGGTSRVLYRFSNLVVDVARNPVAVGWAPSFAIQGINMEEYGRECAQRYGPDR